VGHLNAVVLIGVGFVLSETEIEQVVLDVSMANGGQRALPRIRSIVTAC